MFNFFDYIYYKACEYYSKSGEKDASYSGLIILMVVQGFNLLSILCIINLITHAKININKYYRIIVAIVLLVLNGIR